MKNINMGVLVITSHLIITLVVLAIYGLTLYTGQGDETLKTVLTVIIGYWFGAMGKDMITQKTKPEEEKKAA